jgi:3D (Asp-Asp-Asp) domain-containing protein
MKKRSILISTGFTIVGAWAIYTGSYNLGYEESSRIHTKLLTERTDAYTQEVTTLEREIDELTNEVELKDELLAMPITVSQVLNGEYSKDFKVSKFKISAYSPYDNPNGINSDGNPNKTATGTKPGPGTFAVDPDVIPYGSKMVIMYPDGTIERGVAEDTGGAIKNKRVDVFRRTFNTSMKFGKKDAVVIWY